MLYCLIIDCIFLYLLNVKKNVPYVLVTFFFALRGGRCKVALEFYAGLGRWHGRPRRRVCVAAWLASVFAPVLIAVSCSAVYLFCKLCRTDVTSAF